MPYDPPPPLASLTLDQIADLAARPLPPLAEWSPPVCGDSAMRIAADGRWYHQGSPIARPAMVRAFARLLQRDAEGQHWLVTPHEKLSIAVDDAAFVAVDVVRQGGALAFRLNTDDVVLAGPEHGLWARGTLEAPAMYLGVRHGCEARLDRSTWAQLVDIALQNPGANGGYTVDSLGISFALVPA